MLKIFKFNLEWKQIKLETSDVKFWTRQRSGTFSNKSNVNWKQEQMFAKVKQKMQPMRTKRRKPETTENGWNSAKTKLLNRWQIFRSVKKVVKLQDIPQNQVWNGRIGAVDLLRVTDETSGWWVILLDSGEMWLKTIRTLFWISWDLLRPCGPPSSSCCCSPWPRLRPSAGVPARPPRFRPTSPWRRWDALAQPRFPPSVPR